MRQDGIAYTPGTPPVERPPPLDKTARYEQTVAARGSSAGSRSESSALR